jgi:hypothetical protein
MYSSISLAHGIRGQDSSDPSRPYLSVLHVQSTLRRRTHGQVLLRTTHGRHACMCALSLPVFVSDRTPRLSHAIWHMPTTRLSTVLLNLHAAVVTGEIKPSLCSELYTYSVAYTFKSFFATVYIINMRHSFV